MFVPYRNGCLRLSAQSFFEQNFLNACRYDHWTSPAYYDNTDKKLRHTEEKRIQAKDLEERRAKMKKLINAENKQYADEIAGKLELAQHIHFAQGQHLFQ